VPLCAVDLTAERSEIVSSAISDDDLAGVETGIMKQREDVINAARLVRHETRAQRVTVINSRTIGRPFHQETRGIYK